MITLNSPELFVHHVLFYATAGEQEQAKLLEGLQKLATIPCIRLAHIGTPADTNREVIERTYTYSWLCLFDSAEQEEEYQQHPIHDEFRNEYARYWEKVVIYDATGPAL
jgi:hypothetical protein